MTDIPVSTLSPLNSTDIIVNKKEMKIETVIIILWASGGVLLLVLMMLLVCILKTNRKTFGQGRRESPNVFRIGRDPNESRGGGVNPAFTNYDEIWTWIPVIRGNQGECANECERDTGTGSRENNTASSNDALSRTLEPPPYSVAITTPSYPPGGVTYTTANPTSGENSRYLYSVSNESTNMSSSIVTTCTTALSRPVVSSSVSNNVGSHGDRQNNINTSNSRHKSVINVVHKNERDSERNQQRTWDVRDPWRSPEISRPDVAIVTEAEPRIQGRRSRDMTRSRTHYVRDARHQVSRPTSNDITYHIPEENVALPNTDDIHTLYPELFGNEVPVLAHAQRMSREFVYDAEAGLYSFTTENNGPRVWCDIPPSLLDEEGPPPYTPPPDYPGHRNRQQRRRDRSRPAPKANNSVTDRRAPLVRLEYDYF
ncbi:uncharacterized protein LOC132555815 [Ylistrum balloti]|uniref:uncharacterized protein LOC132555815 n=1 Tax=Ylistrum balloti TaxID=509963 RepID=UPI002905A2F0|nr:uncharacterized protein LOC132555815 [Ylistrum balloti]